uniref:Pentacotripeptide-repeat region of PRORP domain-containing protein n=1 Tax=Daucus carota subsp. sativus TaxID=79200 RepID=A0A169WU55_DAUCS
MDEADRLMREMRGFGLYPGKITYVAMTKGFVEGDRLEEACGLFKVMESHGCLPNTVMYSTLLDGVCSLGSPDKALQLLGEMEKAGGDSKPNVITYTSVIQSYCENGKSLEALSILDRMVANGYAPNRVTASTLIKLICRFVGESFVSDT